MVIRTRGRCQDPTREMCGRWLYWASNSMASLCTSSSRGSRSAGMQRVDEAHPNSTCWRELPGGGAWCHGQRIYSCSMQRGHKIRFLVNEQWLLCSGVSLPPIRMHACIVMLMCLHSVIPIAKIFRAGPRRVYSEAALSAMPKKNGPREGQCRTPAGTNQPPTGWTLCAVGWLRPPLERTRPQPMPPPLTLPPHRRLLLD